MTLSGVDADDQSFDERSDHTLARRYMNYEIRGEANDQEREWLYAHPVEWLRALLAARADVQHHIGRARRDLRSDSRRPTPSATPEQQQAWLLIKQEVDRAQGPRVAFLNKLADRISTVRELLPNGRVGVKQLDVLIPALLQVELAIRDGDPLEARRNLSGIILKLAGEEK